MRNNIKTVEIWLRTLSGKPEIGILIKLENNTGNRKNMWSTINDVLGRNRSGKKSMQFVIDGEIFTDERIIGKSFNEYFSNIGERLANKIPRNNEEDYF